METRAAVLRVLLLLVLATTVSGCQAIATIFEAGFWVGAIAVLVIVALIGFVVMKFRPR